MGCQIYNWQHFNNVAAKTCLQQGCQMELPFWHRGEMTTLSLACHFAGINYHVTRVRAQTSKHKWEPSLTTLLESPKKIGHLVILAPVAKASFVNKKK
jgi:hypothetical protein